MFKVASKFDVLYLLVNVFNCSLIQHVHSFSYLVLYRVALRII